MEKFPKTQETPELNFLDSKLVINLTHSPETIAQYPDITPEDLETKKERYRILLGKIGEVEDGQVSVSIDAVLELEKGDLPVHLEVQEGYGKVTNVNLRDIRNLFEAMKSTHPELRDLEFIGDMHTHPILPKEDNEAKEILKPSQDDIRDIVKNYEAGNLDKRKPFVFSIAGIDPEREGKMQYAFYRLIFEGGEYKAESL